MGVGADRPTEEKMVDFTVLLIETDHATRLTLDSTGEVVSLETGADPEAPAGAVVDARLLARAAALGVVDMLSTHSATRAVELAGCEVVATVSMNDGLGEDARVAAVLEARPDVILVAGGTDGGDEEHAAPLARIAGRARDEMTAVLGRRPEIAFAGNAEALPTVRDVLGAGTFHETANVRPECEREDLAPAVGLVARLVGGKAFGGADVRTAGSARAVAAAELTRHLDGGVLLLHRVGERAEAASHLAGSWSRVEVASGGVPAAIARHRHRARELQGVPLEREIADAFAGHVPGRDLIDVDPPSLVVATGSLLDLADPVGSATALVEALGPRRVLRLVRGDADLLTLLGAASLLGLEVSRESWGPRPRGRGGGGGPERASWGGPGDAAGARGARPRGDDPARAAAGAELRDARPGRSCGRGEGAGPFGAARPRAGAGGTDPRHAGNAAAAGAPDPDPPGQLRPPDRV
jgi:hypothetical protein